MRYLYSIYYLFVFGFFCTEGLDFGFSFSAISKGLSAVGLDRVKTETYCKFYECCDDESIRYNFPGHIQLLGSVFKEVLVGQHIVINQLIPALQAHVSEAKSQKPLVISFHGTPGTGKNYVAYKIAGQLYARGIKSKYVHKYLGKADFPDAEKTDIYRERINREVRAGISDCPRSLFIFDEVDKMPSGIFESLASLIDYGGIDKIDSTQAIFLFLSNTAGVHISDRLGELMKGGMAREDTKISHFEQTIQIAAYNMKGGFQKSSLIENHLIDHYLPFLPLEKKHIYKCIEEELRRWQIKSEPQMIETIIQQVVTYDKNYGLFATAGCKNIEKKVAVYVKAAELKYDL